jgi:hypothetical protein
MSLPHKPVEVTHYQALLASQASSVRDVPEGFFATDNHSSESLDSTGYMGCAGTSKREPARWVTDGIESALNY